MQKLRKFLDHVIQPSPKTSMGLSEPRDRCRSPMVYNAIVYSFAFANHNATIFR